MVTERLTDCEVLRESSCDIAADWLVDCEVDAEPMVERIVLLLPDLTVEVYDDAADVAPDSDTESLVETYDEICSREWQL